MLYVHFEFSYNNYYKHKDRIYRVETIKVNISQSYPGTPTGMVSLLRDQVSGVEKVAPIQVQREQVITISTEERSSKYKEDIAFADPYLFEIFDFTWLRGNRNDALSNPNEVVLTESCARRYFSHTEVIGSIITLLPLSEVHFKHNLIFRKVNKETLRYLWIGGIFILLISCVNFINLSSVQAHGRLKEIGIRSVLGSGQFQIISLMGVEMGLLVFMSLIAAVILLWGTTLHFFQLFGIELLINTWGYGLFTPQMILFLFLGGVSLTILATIYPTLIVMSVKTVDAIRKKVTFRAKQFSLMHGLIVLQFAISTIFVFGAIVISKQLTYVERASLGFQAKDVATMRLSDADSLNLAILKNKLLASPFIEAVSFSNNSPSAESNFMSGVQYVEGVGDEPIITQMKFVSQDFVNMFQIELLVGEDLDSKDTANGFVLVNEVMVNRMGLSESSMAVGKELKMGKDMLIIKGVVRDFYVNSLHQAIDPTVLLINPDFYGQLNVKLGVQENPTAIHAGLEQMKGIWQELFPNDYFEYSYIEKTLQQAYKDENVLRQLVRLATIIVLIIACFGLLGLSTAILQGRSKEMAMRKVLGATSSSIFLLLLQGFIFMSTLSLVLSLPLSHLLLHNWLENFAFRIAISPWMYAVVCGGIILSILLTISYQSFQLSITNPAETLKNE